MVNEIGNVYNRYTIIKHCSKRTNKYIYLCRCVCGTEKEVNIYNLKSGSIKSCGCLNKEISFININKYNSQFDGRSKLRLHTIWLSMLSRCYNKKNKEFKNYGGRGIVVCAEWKKDFWAFVKDIGERPNKNYSLNRINNNGPYSKNNCNWATAKEQRRNQRRIREVRGTDIGYPSSELELAFYGVNYG